MRRDDRESQIIELLEYDLEAAFVQLYGLYGKLLLGVAYRYVADLDISQDILQESMMKAFYKIDSYHHVKKGGLFAWLKRIVINESLNYLNSFNVRMMSTYEEETINSISDEDSSDDVAFINKIDINVLTGLIAELPEGYRVVLNMYAIEGYSHREIAAILGIKEGSASSRYYRAKQELIRRVERWKKEREQTKGVIGKKP